ncbi:MAG: aryl-alcohol dehydrogenase [Candidatus Poriferisodalaceae bacterium]|jgi:aryl-alcohol dehydrogenase
MIATAAVLHSSDAPYELAEVALQEPQPGEVRVRIVGAGMCHTDTSMRSPFRDITFPAVLGHEGAGVIEAVGPGVDFSVGQPVVLSFRSCRGCASCLNGVPVYCDEMLPMNFGLHRGDGTTAISIDGSAVGSHFFGQSSFATHAIADARSVVAVTENDPLDLIGPLGCGVQTGAGAILNTLQPATGSSVAILGSGAVGLSGLLAAVMAGCSTIIAVDQHQNRLDLAGDLGATHAIGADVDLTAALLEATDGRGVDHIFDTTGVGHVITAAAPALAIRGALATVAAHGQDAVAEINLRTLLPGRSIRGVLEGEAVPQSFIPELLTRFHSGDFPFDRLITHFSFDQINEAEAASADGDVIKPVLLMP